MSSRRGACRQIATSGSKIQSISVTIDGNRKAAALRIDTDDDRPYCPVCEHGISGRWKTEASTATTLWRQCRCGAQYAARKLDHGGWKTAAFLGAATPDR